MSDINTIGILGYPDCSEQDTITPLEILKGAALVLGQKLNPLPLPAGTKPQDLTVQLVSLNPGNVKMQMGTLVTPDAVLADQTFDMLYVPGGVGSGAMSQNQRVLDLIRRHYQSGKVVASNCSGVGILFRAGILGKTPVTCVAGIVGRLRELGANVPDPRRMWRGVPDARLWTTTGSYGVNGSTVALVSHYFGKDVAGLTVSTMFDTLGGIGQDAFELIGPEFHTYSAVEAQLQSFWGPKLLP
jgi:transcriptional regulator GlxA family with amidase domain